MRYCSHTVTCHATFFLQLFQLLMQLHKRHSFVEADLSNLLECPFSKLWSGFGGWLFLWETAVGLKLMYFHPFLPKHAYINRTYKYNMFKNVMFLVYSESYFIKILPDQKTCLEFHLLSVGLYQVEVPNKVVKHSSITTYKNVLSL